MVTHKDIVILDLLSIYPKDQGKLTLFLWIEISDGYSADREHKSDDYQQMLALED